MLQQRTGSTKLELDRNILEKDEKIKDFYLVKNALKDHMEIIRAAGNCLGFDIDDGNVPGSLDREMRKTMNNYFEGIKVVEEQILADMGELPAEVINKRYADGMVKKFERSMEIGQLWSSWRYKNYSITGGTPLFPSHLLDKKRQRMYQEYWYNIGFYIGKRIWFSLYEYWASNKQIEIKDVLNEDLIYHGKYKGWLNVAPYMRIKIKFHKQPKLPEKKVHGRLCCT